MNWLLRICDTQYPPLGAQPGCAVSRRRWRPDQLICRADESVSDTRGPCPECVADVFPGPARASAGLPRCRHPPAMAAWSCDSPSWDGDGARGCPPYAGCARPARQHTMSAAVTIGDLMLTLISWPGCGAPAVRRYYRMPVDLLPAESQEQLRSQQPGPRALCAGVVAPAHATDCHRGCAHGPRRHGLAGTGI